MQNRSTFRPTNLVVIRDPFSPLWVVRCRKPCGYRGEQWCQGDSPGMEVCWLASSLTEAGAERLRGTLLSDVGGHA